jgi:uncharacterized protein YoxC
MSNDNVDYHSKYLKYKKKYLDIQKDLEGGAAPGMRNSLGYIVEPNKQEPEKSGDSKQPFVFKRIKKVDDAVQELKRHVEFNKALAAEGKTDLINRISELEDAYQISSFSIEDKEWMEKKVNDQGKKGPKQIINYIQELIRLSRKYEIKIRELSSHLEFFRSVEAEEDDRLLKRIIASEIKIQDKDRRISSLESKVNDLEKQNRNLGQSVANILTSQRLNRESDEMEKRLKPKN